MRPVTEELYGVPAERVIGSSNALSYQDNELSQSDDRFVVGQTGDSPRGDVASLT